MKKVIAFLLLSITFQHSFGTIILVFINTDSIVIAADSKGTTKSKIKNERVCKIATRNSILFAATGYVANNEYNVIRSIGSGIGSRTVFNSDCRNSIVTSIKASLTKEMLGAKRFHREEYDSLIKKGIVTVFLVGNDDNIPSAYIYVFYCKDVGESVEVYAPEIKPFRVDKLKHGGVLVSGDIDVKNPFNEKLDKVTGEEQNKYAIGLIEWQSKKDSSFVAPPVTIGKLTSSGVSWVNNKKCALQ